MDSRFLEQLILLVFRRRLVAPKGLLIGLAQPAVLFQQQGKLIVPDVLPRVEFDRREILADGRCGFAAKCQGKPLQVVPLGIGKAVQLRCLVQAAAQAAANVAAGISRCNAAGIVDQYIPAAGQQAVDDLGGVDAGSAKAMISCKYVRSSSKHAANWPGRTRPASRSRTPVSKRTCIARGQPAGAFQQAAIGSGIVDEKNRLRKIDSTSPNNGQPRRAAAAWAKAGMRFSVTSVPSEGIQIVRRALADELLRPAMQYPERRMLPADAVFILAASVRGASPGPGGDSD